MSYLTFSTTFLDSLSTRAEQEPLGADISDYSDEFCDGFIAGQVNAIEHLLRMRSEASSAPTISAAAQAGSAPAAPEARRAILAEVDSERDRQDAKWGGIPGTERRDDHTYAAVLGEEFGECCKAWIERDIAALRSELVQTAAVAVAWAEELDNGGSRPRPGAPSGGGGE